MNGDDTKFLLSMRESLATQSVWYARNPKHSEMSFLMIFKNLSRCKF